MKTYPPYPVPQFVRRGFMLFLIASFFIIAPLVILYTAGFRYDIHTKEVATTGVLSVDIVTEDVSITVNDTNVYDANPLRLPQLAPGLYTIRVEKPGFHTWEQTVQVRSNETTYVKDIVLLQHRLPVALLYSTDETNPQTLSDVGSLLYYQREEATSTKHAILLLTEQRSHTIRIDGATTTIPTTISFIPHSSLFQYHYTAASNHTYVAYVDGTNPQNFASYKGLIVGDQQAALTNGTLYASVGQWIEKFSPTEQSLLRKVATSTSWVVDTNEVVWEFIPKERLLRNGEGTEITLPLATIAPIAVTNTYILAKDTLVQGFHIFMRSGNSILKTHQLTATAARYNAATDHWYLWSDWELWEFDGTRINLLHRSAVPIREIAFLDNAHAILLRTDSSLVAFDTTYYSHTPLLEDVSVTDVTVNQETRQIFYIGTDATDTAGVYSIDY